MTTDRLEAESFSANAAADERERVADRREFTADQREQVADEREERLAAWEKRLDRRAHALGHASPSHRQRSYEAIERARGLMEASQDRLDRSEAALRRADARDDREQSAVESESADSRARQVNEGQPPQEALESRAHRSHKQLAATAAALRIVHDSLAGEYEQLALEQPRQATEYRLRAERARQLAAHLHAVQLAGDEGGD